MWNRTENQITLVLIRHGETEANREHRYLGKTEEPLSKEGICRLEANKVRQKYPGLAMLFISPMRRCRETAEILYPQMQPVVISEWTEMDFGAFEGKNYEDLKQDDRYQAWIDSGGVLPFPEGESREEFILRCENGFYKMLEMVCKEKEKEKTMPETVGLLVHGGTIMALLSSFGKGEYFDYQVPTGEGWICRLTETAGRLRITGIQNL